MLAQSVNIDSGMALGGVATLIVAKGADWWKEWLKDRRERESEGARLEVLKDIAATNQKILMGQMEQNWKGETHHIQLVEAIKATCKLPKQ